MSFLLFPWQERSVKGGGTMQGGGGGQETFATGAMEANSV